ncbi:hypothetical protein K469DRAFT_395701 [Zopfia rhizophila CBS 207.26]|uniref:Uncharacterized protein n=1 Tax=Zopfia rhizophila CBS 207.26 TaxID=1314779 RepID=A0A6A6DEQ9_9PEZI|nr:hypothetical protein K469DRAFT_395701 [Zopfia rhizophila CBS 207.26]
MSNNPRKPNTTQSQPHTQWTTSPTPSASQTTTTTTSSSSQQQTQSSHQYQTYHPHYPSAFQSQQGQSQFQAYAPTPQTSNTVTSSHQITAPFQIPRMPHPWPHPNQKEQTPVDPQLLGQGGSGGGYKGPAAPSQWQRPT